MDESPLRRRSLSDRILRILPGISIKYEALENPLLACLLALRARVVGGLVGCFLSWNAQSSIWLIKQQICANYS